MKTRFASDLTSYALFALTVTIVFATSSIVRAEDFLNGQLTVNPIPTPTMRVSATTSREGTTHGYMEYRFAINNKSDRSHQVTLYFSNPGGGRFGETTIGNASTTVVVEPKSETTATILQPPVPFSYYTPTLRIRIDNGREQNLNFTASNHGFQRHSYSGSGTVCNILVSNKITANQRELLERGTLEPEKTETEQENAMGMGGYGMRARTPTSTHAVWQSEVPIDQWSDQWLGYTRFDCIVVNNDDMQAMKAEAFRAVRRYVEMGGMFVVLDSRSSQLPKHWVKDADSFAAGITRYDGVQGEAFLMASGGNEESGINFLRERMLDVARRYDGIMRSTENNAETLERIVPMGLSYGVPVRSLVVLVIFFALLIGPVNMLALGFLKRRVWLIWTIPLTSIIASFTVLGLVVFSEGVKKVTSAKTVTILDQRRGEALTSGIVGFYRTFSPPGGIVYSNGTEVTPIVGNMEGLSLGLQTAGSQHLTQNWIRPRIPSFYYLRKVAPSNVRLAFDWNGEPTVTNGLGVKISDLSVVSPDGKRYSADLLEPGQKVVLKLESTRASSEEHVLFKASSSFDSQVTRGSLPDLSRGTYVATIEGVSPFLEPGIDNMKSHTQVNTIFGIFSGDGSPEL